MRAFVTVSFLIASLASADETTIKTPTYTTQGASVTSIEEELLIQDPGLRSQYPALVGWLLPKNKDTALFVTGRHFVVVTLINNETGKSEVFAEIQMSKDQAVTRVNQLNRAIIEADKVKSGLTVQRISLGNPYLATLEKTSQKNSSNRGINSKIEISAAGKPPTGEKARPCGS